MRIEKIDLTGRNEKVRLQIHLSGEGAPGELLWFEFGKEYGASLVTELCDGPLMALFIYCLRNGIDIASDIPASRRMLLNIEGLVRLLHTLAPACYGEIALDIPLCDDCSSIIPQGRSGIVSSGSMGVDAMHSLWAAEHSNYNARPTHLVFNNTGGNELGENPLELLMGRLAKCNELCSEYGYGLVYVDSNYSELFKLHYSLTNLYVNVAIGYMLAKLLHTYNYSSGEIKDKLVYEGDPAGCECMLMAYMSTDYFLVHNVPGDYVRRLQKVKDLIDFEPALRYLNVCWYEVENCCVCKKCRRTIASIECHDALPKFARCFKVTEDSLRNIHARLICDYWERERFIYPMWQYLKNHMNFCDWLAAFRLKGFFWFLRKWFWKHLLHKGDKVKIQKEHSWKAPHLEG
ncbi:MAG: hypothetical protein IJS08_14095 [Victivallales bacterium]|nr:hypothetical protein [Victivallales bacterium]